MTVSAMEAGKARCDVRAFTAAERQGEGGPETAVADSSGALCLDQGQAAWAFSGWPRARRLPLRLTSSWSASRRPPSLGCLCQPTRAAAAPSLLSRPCFRRWLTAPILRISQPSPEKQKQQDADLEGRGLTSRNWLVPLSRLTRPSLQGGLSARRPRLMTRFRLWGPGRSIWPVEGARKAQSLEAGASELVK